MFVEMAGGVVATEPLQISILAPEMLADLGAQPVQRLECPAAGGVEQRAAQAQQFRMVAVQQGVLSRNRRKFRQPINVACPAPGRWGRPNSRVTSRHFDHGNASRTSRPDCSGLDEAD